jgi:hypothetical protein
VTFTQTKYSAVGKYENAVTQTNQTIFENNRKYSRRQATSVWKTLESRGEALTFKAAKVVQPYDLLKGALRVG